MLDDFRRRMQHAKHHYFAELCDVGCPCYTPNTAIDLNNITDSRDHAFLSLPNELLELILDFTAPPTFWPAPQSTWCLASQRSSTSSTASVRVHPSSFIPCTPARAWLSVHRLNIGPGTAQRSIWEAIGLPVHNLQAHHSKTRGDFYLQAHQKTILPTSTVSLACLLCHGTALTANCMASWLHMCTTILWRILKRTSTTRASRSGLASTVSQAHITSSLQLNAPIERRSVREGKRARKWRDKCRHGWRRGKKRFQMTP